MVFQLKVRKVGNAYGLVLPKAALARLKAGAGDVITLTEAPNGGFRLTPATQGQERFAEQMRAAENVVRRYRNTLRELAK